MANGFANLVKHCLEAARQFPTMSHPDSREHPMIDNPDQVERLLHRLRDAVPLPAFASPSLLATLRERSSTAQITPRCTVMRVDYAGDEGGVICHLALDENTGSNVFVVSITHLAFDPRPPLAREIAAYQKRRIKRLRRDHGRGCCSIPLIGDRIRCRHRFEGARHGWKIAPLSDRATTRGSDGSGRLT
jgi:hypothetical protein